MRDYRHVLVLMLLACCPPLAFAQVEKAQVPSWVEPMRKVHADFKGQAGYVAQLGDSITFSMAFWTPIGWDEPQKYLTTKDGLPKTPKGKRWRDVLQGQRDKGPKHGNYSGWTVKNLLNVIDQVLKEKKPEIAIIMVGTNDISGGKVPEAYAGDLEKVLEKCIAVNCVPILNTIPPRVGHEKTVGEVNQIVKRLAKSHHIPIVDYHTEILKRRPEESWQGTLISKDGVHPSGGKTNLYTEENLKNCGYALRNWLNFLAVREVYFRVLHTEAKAPQPGPNPKSNASVPEHDSLIQSIEKVTLRENRDGKSTTWFHPRACLLPKENGQITALMTLQEISGSDYFGPVCWSDSVDGGTTWSEPEIISSLARKPVAGHPGLMAGVCDVVPQYHPPTNTVLALGHVVFYRGPRFAKSDQLARYPVYAVRHQDGTWSERKILKWNDERGVHIYSNNCGQRVILPNGDIVMSFTFGPTAKNRMVAGVRCCFDGETLKILEVGPPLKNPVGRGLLEPSVTKFRDKFFITMRAEDDHGYVAVSDDGLNYQRKTAWAWEDGESVTMSTTQQHWLTHSDGLFLVYTRKDSTNTHVIRWRSPLWVARVDPDKLCLIRQSEKVVLPLEGDGINHPYDVPIMGNFHVTNVSPQESWVTVGEWRPRRGAKGDLLLAKIRWTQPNQLAVRSPE